MENLQINNKQELINLVEELEAIKNEGGEIELGKINTIDKYINEKNDLYLDSSFEYFIKNKIQKIKQYAMKNKAEKVTKWDVFAYDMHQIEGIEGIIELVDRVSAKKDDCVSEEELNEIESMYKKVLPLIHEKLSVFDRERAIREFNKKIKLFKNRLNRVIEDDFGSWIKQLRKAKGYSLKDLENASGVTASYIHRIETGSRKTPSIPVAESLATALGVSQDDFLRNLNILSSEPKKNDNFSLSELLAINNFTINGKRVDTEQKNAIINLLNNILSAEWTAESKFAEGMNLIQDIDKIKASLAKDKINDSLDN